MERKPFITQYGYDCRYFPTIMSGPVFRWTRGEIEVNASREGVGIRAQGMIGDVSSLRSVLESALYVYDRLSKNDRPDGLMFDGVYIEKEKWINP